MACIQLLPLLFCSFLYIFNLNPSYAQISSSPVRSLVLPVTKDPATLQYLTTIYHGTSQEPIRVVIDLGCPSLWLYCSSGRLSSSRRLVPSCSIQCPAAKPSNV
ncbi:ASPARTYL PROTEASE-RELATED, partial [Salix koriyanagi]